MNDHRSVFTMDMSFQSRQRTVARVCCIRRVASLAENSSAGKPGTGINGSGALQPGLYRDRLSAFSLGLASLLRACSIPNTVRFTLCFIGVCVFLAMPRVVTDRVHIEPLNFCSGPGRFSKKFQTAVDARLARKTIDVDAITQPLPAVLSDQVLEDRFQRHAV